MGWGIRAGKLEEMRKRGEMGGGGGGGWVVRVDGGGGGGLEIVRGQEAWSCRRGTAEAAAPRRRAARQARRTRPAFGSVAK